MVILKAIGAFFVKIWRWIKETAWVQPLLIVGGIFAIIFAIPHITKWAKTFSKETEGVYFTSYQVSLEGEKWDEKSVSDADKLTDSIYTNTVERIYGAEDPTAVTKADLDLGGYEEKFFLVFVKNDCSNCTPAEEGFKYLEENWGKIGLNPDVAGEKFAIHTIFSSEDSSNDDDFEKMGSPSAFNRYLYTYGDLFNTVGPVLKDAPYKIRANIADTNYDTFSLNSSGTETPLANFPVPSICLVDYSEKALKENRAGLSEVAFSVSGDSSMAKAQFLLDMWNHCADYSTDNLFTKNA